VDFATGNQCWTLFLNTSNFKGPVTFFIPTHWTSAVLDMPELQGALLDARVSNDNHAFAMEHAKSPAAISTVNGTTYARILPFRFPVTQNNQSIVIQDHRVYSRAALWDDVQAWFDGGDPATLGFKTDATKNIQFHVQGGFRYGIKTGTGNMVIRPGIYGRKHHTEDGTQAGFSWNTDVVTQEDGFLIWPEFYQLQSNDEWLPIDKNEVPESTGLLDDGDELITERSELSYLTPMDRECHLRDRNSPWRRPGPSAGPFQAELGDGSQVTFYWYRFIDQPAMVQADLPKSHLAIIQERVEKIHRAWSYTDEYMPAPTDGELAGLDPGLIVQPPSGYEIGYVPIVTRQEKRNRKSR
jgi:hypothetical protein